MINDDEFLTRQHPLLRDVPIKLDLDERSLKAITECPFDITGDNKDQVKDFLKLCLSLIWVKQGNSEGIIEAFGLDKKHRKIVDLITDLYNSIQYKKVEYDIKLISRLDEVVEIPKSCHVGKETVLQLTLLLCGKRIHDELQLTEVLPFNLEKVLGMFYKDVNEYLP